MNQLFGQMFKMPLGLVQANLDFMARTIKDLQGNFDQSQLVSQHNLVAGSDCRSPATKQNYVTPIEETRMNHMQTYQTHSPQLRQTQGNRCYVSDCDPYQSYNDCDLSGEGVIKRIRWYVTFAREDYVASLEIDGSAYHEEIITENTTHDRVWGEKKGVFIGAMAAGRVAAPASWVTNPPDEATIVGGNVVGLNREGLEDYLDIQIECVGRSCEVKPCYEKDQVKVLRSLSTSVQQFMSGGGTPLGDGAAAIGPFGGGRTGGGAAGYASMTNDELKDVLRDRKLPVGGNKEELIGRIVVNDAGQ